MITDSDLATLQAQIASLQKRVNDFETRPMTQNPLVAPFLNLPGQVGLWAAGAVQRSTGNLYDLSGQGRALTLNGNPAINLHNNFVPFYNLDGTGDFFSRADESDLDVTGTETIFDSTIRGVTMIGVYQLDVISYAQTRGFMSKDGIASQRSYGMFCTASGQIQAMVSSDGTTGVLSSGPQLGTSNYFMGWMRWKPSTYLDAGINLPIAANYVRNTTSIPASLFAGTAPFNIGCVNSDGVNRIIDGRFVIGTLCATALSDEWLAYLCNAVRGPLGF